VSAEDFDLDSLAAYLHLAPQQVARLADRGKLPGRKVGGQWRFSQAEIHHWLEQRIGLSDEGQLVQVEQVIERSAGPGEEPPAIAALVPIEAIAVPLPARTRDSVIRSMVELAAGTGWLWDPDKLADAVRAREEMQPTALDNGVALLHPRRPMPGILDRAFVALGRTTQGIAFGGARSLTDLFFLILSTDDRGHLRTLARLSRLLADPQFLSDLREAGSPGAVHRTIADYESRLA
jgi:nitrogen PTS system EIIA component